MFLGKLVSGMMMVAMVPAFALACGTKGENPSDKMLKQLKALSNSKLTCTSKISNERGSEGIFEGKVSIVAKYKCMNSPVQGRLTVDGDSDVITGITMKKSSKVVTIVTATASVACIAK